MADYVTFSLRMSSHYDTLRSVAHLNRVSIAEQSRRYILTGLRKALDPAAIEQQVEEQRRQLLAAAAEMNR